MAEKKKPVKPSGSESELKDLLSALSENLLAVGEATMENGDNKKHAGDPEGARSMYIIGGTVALIGQAIEDSLSR